MEKQEIKNEMPWALISGGSRGLGYAIAAALAKRNYNLLLTARNEEDLNKAKKDLELAFAVRVEIFALDMSIEESTNFVSSWIIERQLPLKMVCNVAGGGGAADYPAGTITDSLLVLRTNIESAVSLIYHLLPLLKKNQPSFILNVSSIAGFAPVSIKNIYSSAKSAVIFFSYSLRYQLRKENISVSCLCPGPVFTKSSIREETIEKMGWFGKQMAVDPQKVGEIAVSRTLKKSMIIVPGLLTKTVSIFLRIIPMRWAAYLTKSEHSD